MAYRVNKYGLHGATLSGGEDVRGDLVIPRAVDGVAIEAIGMRAFYANEGLTGVTIPQGVAQIEDLAFARCHNLKTVTLPKGLNGIWNDAFWDCPSLKNIAFPEGLTMIDTGAFSGCTSLERIVIPKSVKKIGSRAFEGCTSLRSIVFSGNADMQTDIETDILTGCTALESADFPTPQERRKLPSIHAPDTLKRVSVGAGDIFNSSYWSNRVWREWLGDLCIFNPNLRELILPENAKIDDSIRIPPHCRIIRR